MGAVWLQDGGCLSGSDLPNSAQKCKCNLLISRSQPTGPGHFVDQHRTGRIQLLSF